MILGLFDDCLNTTCRNRSRGFVAPLSSGSVTLTDTVLSAFILFSSGAMDLCWCIVAGGGPVDFRKSQIANVDHPFSKRVQQMKLTWRFQIGHAGRTARGLDH